MYIDWDQLKIDYASLIIENERDVLIESKTRRRLMERYTGSKTTKKKKAKTYTLELPVKSAKKKMIKVKKSKGSEKSTKGGKSSLKTKKCKKVKVNADPDHSDSFYDVKRRTTKKLKSKKHSGGVYKKVSKTYTITYSHARDDISSTPQDIGSIKHPKSKGKGGKSGKVTKKKSKLPKSSYNESDDESDDESVDKYEYEYKVVCDGDGGGDGDGGDGDGGGDGDDGSPTRMPSIVREPTQSPPNNSSPQSFLPSPSPQSLPPSFSSSLPTNKSPSSSPPTTNSPNTLPSTRPTLSLSASPSVSNKPTIAGATRSPSSNPSKSLMPSERPTLKASPEPSQQPSISFTVSPAPSISFAPTLEDVYRYDAGNCPNQGSTGLQCSDPNLRKVCDRYDEEFGSFRKCWEICKPAFCCIHDAKNNFKAQSCSQDENCAQYAYCYIVWFHFHDTFGPATYLDIENEGNFFDVKNNEVQGKFNDEFFDNLYFHHFDNVAEIIQEGTVQGQFVYEKIFEESDYWQEE